MEDWQISAGDTSEATAFQRDLYLYWREVTARGGVALTSRRYLTRRALRQVRSALAAAQIGGAARTDAHEVGSEGDFLRIYFARRLLERLSLLRLDPEQLRLHAAPWTNMERYLAHPLAERLRICTRVWVAGGWWPDVFDAQNAPPRIHVPAPARVALARRRLIETLLALPLGETIHIAFPSSGGPATRSQPTGARLVPLPEEAESVRAALLGPLRWLGFVAGDEAGMPEIPSVSLPDLIVRRTPALAALRTSSPDEPGRDGPAAGNAPDGAAGTEVAEEGGRVVVQPNLDLLAFPPLPAPTLATLDALAECDAIDGVARFHLSRAALARARERGWHADDVRERLEALSGSSLPANVAVVLADWARSLNRLRLTQPAPVLTVRGPQLLDALLADPTARDWVERRIAPTVALLRPDVTGLVRQWLLRHGEIPAYRRPPERSDG